MRNPQFCVSGKRPILRRIFVFSFLPGTGSALVYLAAVDAVVQLFSIKYVAQVMLVLSIARNISVSTYMLMYYLFFYGDGTPIGQDPCGYFLLLGVLTLALHIVVYIVYKLHDTIPVFVKEEQEILEDNRKNDRDSANADLNGLLSHNYGATETTKINSTRSGLDAEIDQDSPTQKHSSGDYSTVIFTSSLDDFTGINTGSDGTQVEASEPHGSSTKCGPDLKDDKWKNIKPMLRSYKFHLLFWPATAITCLRVVCTANLGTLLLSFHISHYPQIIFHIPIILCITIKLGLSILFHFFSSRVPQVGLLTAGAFLSMESFLLGLYHMQDLNILIVLVILWTLAGGVTTALLPAILASEFGKDTSAVSMGAVNAAVGIIQLALQAVFSGLYDRQITDGSKICYGVHCFYTFFVTSAALSGLCLILLMIYMHIQRRSVSTQSQ